MDILSKYYPIIGAKAMVLLPGRTDVACVGMAQKIGIAAPGTGPWSECEIEVLRNHYPQMGTDAALLLPGRSSGSTGDMARKLGISGPEWEWTAADDEIIKTEYPHMGPSVAALLNGRRTETACAQRAQFLGVSCPIEELMWSEEEIEVLRKNYPLLGRKTANLLPGRTEMSCSGMARKLRLFKKGRVSSEKKPWSSEEIRILKESYHKLGVSGVQKLLPDRSTSACSNMAIRLGLTPKHSMDQIKWTDEEITILKENYSAMGKDVAQLLPRRTIATCQRKASEMGLTYSAHFWSEAEDRILKEYYPKEGIAVSQRLPKKSKISCKQRVQKLGLRRLRSTDIAEPGICDADEQGQSSHDAAPEDRRLINVSGEPLQPEETESQEIQNGASTASFMRQSAEEAEADQQEQDTLAQPGILQMQ